jgi:hypothetical protein
MSKITVSEESTPPPTQYELPCDDGVPMETQRHKLQMDMLIDTLSPWLAMRNDWQGIYKGVEAVWLRWVTIEAELLPTSDDIAQEEKRRARAELASITIKTGYR